MRAAAVRQPAHDHPVAADQLLAVDGHVLPGLVHAAVTNWEQSRAPHPAPTAAPAKPAAHVRELRNSVLLAFTPAGERVAKQLAQRLHNEVPGIVVPEPVQERLRAAGAGAREIGLELARELLAEAEQKAAGIYVVAPFRRPLGVLELLAST